MQYKTTFHRLAAVAAAVLLASCGGGGDGDGDASSLALSGTAATGAALASASVQVKCKAGDGTATTSASGGYTLTISGGQLPCIVKVSGTTAGGAAIVLHSIVETGTAGSGTTTNATANVTPVTEMIVAQIVGAMPSDAFSNFDPAEVTKDTVAAALTAIVDALKTAGIDLTGIDPLKAALVPATGTTAGNAYDKLLDTLGETVTPESLPLVVNQIATAADTGSSTGLTDAMAAVSSGALANCPVALSGKYRTIDYTGGTYVHTLDFKAMTWSTEGVGSPQPIVAGSQACEISLDGVVKIVFGPNGAGAFQAPDVTGYVFPVQPHPLSSVATTWNFLESGLNESDAGEHFFGKFTVAADGKVTVCEHDVMNGVANFGSTCEVDDSETITLAAASDGGFELNYGGEIGRVWGYRGPNGSLNLFGTNNPTGNSSPTAFRTHFVMTKPETLTLPAVGEATKYWDMDVSFVSGTLGTTFSADSNTVTAVDTAAGTVTRTRTSDSRVDTLKVNHPVAGLRFREASSGISSIYQMQIPSLGMSAAIDNMPGHFYGISVRRP